MRNHIRPLVVCLTLAIASPLALADVPPIIDTHTHLNNGAGAFTPGGRQIGPNYSGAIEAAIHKMDHFGIRRILLMPPPMPPGTRADYEIDDMQSAAKTYPDRISLIGGGGSLNAMIQETPADAVTDEIKQQFRARAEQIAAAGAVAFGEIAAHHLSLRRMGPQHAYEWSPPDHPLLLLLSDIAAEKGIPIDLHLDLVPEDMDRPERPIFNPATPSRLKANLAGFERLLDHNRNAKIIWAHAGTDPIGTRNPQVQRRLLAHHPNLYMSLRIGAHGPAPVFALDENGTLKPEWLALLHDFPDRFVLGSDYFFSAKGGMERGADAMAFKNFTTLLQQLPSDLAVAIAHRNAEKLYHLPPLGQGD